MEGGYLMNDWGYCIIKEPPHYHTWASLATNEISVANCNSPHLLPVFGSPITASKVRVQLRGKNYLNLDEVYVYDTLGNDIAKWGAATQSSAYHVDHASAAIDGNPNSYSATNSEQCKNCGFVDK